MRLYLEVAVRSFRRHLAYRAAALAGLCANTVFGILYASVYVALYRDAGGSEEVAGFTLAETLTYVWLAQAMIAVVAIFGWWEIAGTIRSGDVVTDLMKPFDYLGYWLSVDLGRAAANLLIRFVPTLGVGLLFFSTALPGSPLRRLAYALSLVLAVLVAFAIHVLVNLTAFWQVDATGIRTLSYAVTAFFSGMLLPLAFMPAGLRALADVLPLRGMIMSPIEVLLGHGNPLAVLGAQVGWAAVLFAASYAVLGVAVRRLVVQGG